MMMMMMMLLLLEKKWNRIHCLGRLPPEKRRRRRSCWGTRSLRMWKWMWWADRMKKGKKRRCGVLDPGCCSWGACRRC